MIDGDIGFDRCNGSLCSYALYYPSNNPGTHSYQLSSTRTGAGCGSCASQVESGKASASATLVNPPPPPPPPPTPTPTPSPTPTGGTGGSTTGGSTTGGTTTGGSTGGSDRRHDRWHSTGGSTHGWQRYRRWRGQADRQADAARRCPTAIAAARRAFAIRFNAFSPSLGIPKLPPLPANFAPTGQPRGPAAAGHLQPAAALQAADRDGRDHQRDPPLTGVGSTVDWDQLAEASRSR